MKLRPPFNRLEGRAVIVLLVIASGFTGAAYLAAYPIVPRPIADNHIPLERFKLTENLSAAIRTAAIPSTASTLCTELENVIAAWNHWLPAPWMVNPSLLLNNGASCRSYARKLGLQLTNDASRLHLGHQATAQIERIDFTTPNPWRAISGCVFFTEDKNSVPCKPKSLADPWLDMQLLPRALILATQPVSHVDYRGKSVSKGADIQLTLIPDIQAEAKRIAECFTGMLPCDGILPDSMSNEPRFTKVAMRTGMLGLTILDIDSGRILALAGAVSDCTRNNLQTLASPDKKVPRAKPQWHVFRSGGGVACPQVPDSRFHWLLETHPALWPNSPGSTMKPLAVLAALVDGEIPVAADNRLRRILAESKDQNVPRRLALEHGNTFKRLLGEFSFDTPTDILSGSKLENSLGWQLPLRTVGQLQVPKLSFENANRIRADKEGGVNVDAVYGHVKVTDYLAARRIMDTAIGGGDVRFAGALGLADMFRRIDLRARGATVASATHFAEVTGRTAEKVNLEFSSPEQAARLSWMLTGITAVRQHGTAAGACRLAFGVCPPDGLPDLWGKTGTADATLGEGSPYLKLGVLPTKLFGAVFSDRSGRRLAIAAVALRGREGPAGTLELHSNAAAEAALLMVRHLRNPTSSIQ